MTLAELIKAHEYDELIFGGFICLTCTPDEDPDVVAWPCPPLRAAGMTDAHAIAHIENHRLRIELRDKGNDLLAVRGILSPNGHPSRVPMPIGVTVAPSVQWLADEVERLRGVAETAVAWRRAYGSNGTALAGNRVTALVTAIDALLALPNTQEPCDTCSSTASGCAECQPIAPGGGQ